MSRAQQASSPAILKQLEELLGRFGEGSGQKGDGKGKAWGPREPKWHCAACGAQGNWASRAQCRTCSAAKSGSAFPVVQAARARSAPPAPRPAIAPAASGPSGGTIAAKPPATDLDPEAAELNLARSMEAWARALGGPKELKDKELAKATARLQAAEAAVAAKRPVATRVRSGQDRLAHRIKARETAAGALEAQKVLHDKAIETHQAALAAEKEAEKELAEAQAEADRARTTAVPPAAPSQDAALRLRMAQLAADGGSVADLLAAMDRHLENVVQQQLVQPRPPPPPSEQPQGSGEEPGAMKVEPPLSQGGAGAATPQPTATPKLDDDMDGARGVIASASLPTGASPPTKRAKAVTIAEPTPAEAAAGEVKPGQ